ncbi:proline oxidase PrnD [Ophiocordyceps sinensis CO18]|uniref:Proline dehydrogenase n=1 Tax=Ophiocordyceps sinensis (strain Co18 / CGMCC 3.14243) TaxID=911162 RepID=T5ACR9_OPHSC|nr:proline oxidase PrnD [Ophiocordyceps sinensis CO18]
MRQAPVGVLCFRRALAVGRYPSPLGPCSAVACFSAQPPPSCIVASAHGGAGLAQRRGIHSSDKKSSTMAEFPGTEPPPPCPEPNRGAPLSVLPLAMILRSLGTNVVSSSPLLLPPSLRIMAMLAHSTNPLLNPDRNRLLRYVLKKSFYAQFCAGEDAAEVGQTISRLKGIGFTGVILCYAREVVLSDKEAGKLDKVGEETPDAIEQEIIPWTQGTLETVRLTEPGDFAAIKFTGAGRVALHRLAHRLPASPVLHNSIDSICQLAHGRGVRLLFDAEQDMLQDGIDDWTMEFARKYNTVPDSATIYGTYQAYKKCAPVVLSRHLAEAREAGFSLGVKLVRGAYLGSDPRGCFFDTKAETDACYDGIAACVLTRQWGAALPGQGEFPASHLMLATHNADSVRRARAICDAGGAKSDISFAQLQGMADEISCELVEAGQSARVAGSGRASALPAYKYLVWGTTGECMKYLLRRAHENKDAVQRTRSGRDAMWAELVRRGKNALRVSV